jgi:hypothetical protein
MRWLKVGLVVGGLLVLVLGAHGVHELLYPPESGARAVADHQMPQLFDDAALAPYTPALHAQAGRATTLMDDWWRSHGTKPQDEQFLAWLAKTLPAPPSADSRKAEAATLEKLAKTRSAYPTNAGQWLGMYGARDLWLYYEKRESAHLSEAQRLTRRKQLAGLLTMSKVAGRSLAERRQQPAPFLIDHALRPGQKVRPGQTCPCSYPAGVDVAAAAGQAFLSYLYPDQAAVYRHLDDEYEFSHLYFGERLPSDLDAGTLVGDMLGEYFLVTRADGSPRQVTAALAGSGSTDARSGGAPAPTAGSTAGRG